MLVVEEEVHVLVRGHDVVLRGAVVLDHAEVRSLPADPVLGDGETRVALPLFRLELSVDHPRPGVHGLVEHLENALFAVEEGASGEGPSMPDDVALPGTLGPEDRVVVDLLGGVQDLLGVRQALYQVVVDEELLGRSDLD